MVQAIEGEVLTAHQTYTADRRHDPLGRFAPVEPGDGLDANVNAIKLGILERIPEEGIKGACRSCNVHPFTFYRWRAADPAYNAAVEEAFRVTDDGLEHSLVRRALDPEATGMAPVVAAIAVLKSRNPARWAERFMVPPADGTDMAAVVQAAIRGALVQQQLAAPVTGSTAPAVDGQPGNAEPGSTP